MIISNVWRHGHSVTSRGCGDSEISEGFRCNSYNGAGPQSCSSTHGNIQDKDTIMQIDESKFLYFTQPG